MVERHWDIWIDTGGTFTDCFAIRPGGQTTSLKILSNSSLRTTVSLPRPDVGVTECSWSISKNILADYRAIVLQTGQELEIIEFNPDRSEFHFDQPVMGIKDSTIQLSIESNEEVPVFASRILTQTSLGDPLPPIRMRLGSTRGTNALLERKGAPTALLITAGFRDLIKIGTQQRPDIFSLQIEKPNPYYEKVFEIEERMDASGNVLKSINPEEIERIGQQLEVSNIETVAIVFMHSYKNPDHENMAGQILSKLGIKHISLSSDLFNAVKILPRAETAVANAYLSPVIKNYISGIEGSIFKDHPSDLKVMTSAGGLVSSSIFKPKDSLLSGPAGGLVGASVTASRSGINKVLTIDMGGTSTDVARYDNGFDYRYETKVGNAQILSPALYIETIAAGGGSICGFDGYRFTVGPESAGAEPGPACYGSGGPLTITDVNLLLGKIDPEYFGIPVHMNAPEEAIDKLIKQIENQFNKQYLREEVLAGFEQIANERMAEAIKKISVSKGYDPEEYTLLAFGGAGGQHACQIAKLLGIEKILIPKDAGLLSAYGIGKAFIERFAEKQILKPLDDVKDSLDSIISGLEKKVLTELRIEGFNEKEIQIRDRFFYLRFSGQESTLELQNSATLAIDFKEKYTGLYGHWIEDREIELESIKVVGCNIKYIPSQISKTSTLYEPVYQKTHMSWINGKWEEIPSYEFDKLLPGASVKGPSVIGSKTSTTFVDRDWHLTMDEAGNCLMSINSKNKDISKTLDTKPEEAELELFSNRFTSVAEEMGAMFQRTSFSVNIKERLDFSCAILDPEGYLVVNAPHIPVHLGSLGICVRNLFKSIEMEEGDVIITNHPRFGGSHLPDITLVSPVFHKKQLAGFVANRGHHAEIGGISPGSMPPNAKSLIEEGVVIHPTHLLKNGKARWDKVRDIFINGPYPTRSIEENMADLNGALASIRLGVSQMHHLIETYGMEKITEYMDRIRKHAQKAIKKAIIPYNNRSFRATEYLDNGAHINVEIKVRDQKVIFDFTGTSPILDDNFNATPAITTSVILYVLRLIAGQRIPLNEGLLDQVDIQLPGNFLNPNFEKPDEKCPPVVGGNTETSQRLADTLIKAFELAACSQGTMNNLIFGNKSFGYYETIGGGTGAGPQFNGADAVHQHMTNTRITDPEILELRYPVMLNEFSIRRNSGGDGAWKGGNGIIRKITFLEPLELTIMSQHRIQEPFGLDHGDPGEKGKQWIERDGGKIIDLMGCDSSSVRKGDSIIIQTPGGGGYGSPGSRKSRGKS